MNMKVAVFPGSFDPFTIGHQAIVFKAAQVFDKVIVAIGINLEKQYVYTIEERKKFIESAFEDMSNITVDSYEGLTVDFCKKIDATHIVRGLRNPKDFEFEQTIANVNTMLDSDIETVFFLTPPELSSVSSSVVREVIKNGGDASNLTP